MKGKGQPPQSAGVATTRQPPQNARGSTPPQQRGPEGDFQGRSQNPISFQGPPHMMQVQPGMQHQSQPFQRQPRLQGGTPFFPTAARPLGIRPAHPPPQQQNPMYQSPPSGSMMQFVTPQGTPAFIPQQQQYVQPQNEYNQAPQVVSGPLQFRQVVPQQVAGQFAPVPSPTFSQQQSPYGMQQAIYTTQPQQPYYIFKAPNPVPQQQPSRPPEQKRERRLIQIRDPNQDNKDVTQEILMTGSQSGSGTPNSTPDVSGRSSSSSTPPVNLHNDAGAQFAMQVAATLDSDKPGSNKSSPQTSKSASPAVIVDQAPHSEPTLVETSRGVVEVKVKQAVVQPETKTEKKPQQSQPVVENQKQSSEVLPAEKENIVLEEEVKSQTEPKHDEVKQQESKSIELKSEELKCEENAKEIDGTPVLVSTSEIKTEMESDSKVEQACEVSENIVTNGLTDNDKDIPGVEAKEDVQITDVSKPLSSETATDNENKVTELEKPDIICTEESISQEVASENSTLPDEQKINGHEQQSVSEKIPAESTRGVTESQLPVKDAMPKKKKKSRFREFDKKDTGSDLMDAYTEKPAKVEPPPVEDKEVPVNKVKTPTPPIEDQTPVEEKSWEDKDELFTEDQLEIEEDGMDDMEPESEAADRKLTYDRDFLLKFQYEDVCKEKPEGLPDIEVVLDTARAPQKTFPNNRLQGADFAPPWMKQGRPGNQRHNMQSGSRKIPPKKIILPAAQKVEQLKRSENAWVRPKDKDKESPEKAKTDELYRKVTSILNKLTPQKFQTLMNQILELDIDTPERLEGVIERIFEKAISEPGFSVAYANMCRSLMMIKVRVQIEDKEGKETKEGQVSFRKILLNKCQKEFEKEKSEENLVHAKMDALAQQGLSEDELKLRKADLEIEEINMRRRSLGNIRFIGELFKLKMLTENIMHDCVVKLLRSTDEESYECLCKLLSTIGKDLDHEKAKPRVDQYFEQIKKIVQARRTSSRVRFMMIDVLDLRKNNWVPRREDNNPKTIDQIHKEAQEQEKKTTMMIQQAKLQKRDNRGGRDSPRNVGVPQADDGWTSVAKGGTKKGDFDPKKFQNISKQRLDEGNISLGPGGRGYGSWARGSSGGTGPGSAPGAGGPGEQPSNRYSALSSQGDAKRTQGPQRQTGAGRPDVRSPVPQGASGKRGPVPSEREKALEAVRRQTSREGQGKPTYERTSSKPGPDAVEPVPEPEARASPPVQELSEDQIRDKTEATLKEFLNIRDFKEAVQCFKDLKSPSMAYVFVATALESTLEKHESERRVTGQLFSKLLKEGLLTMDQFVKGIDQILEFAEDMEIDVPHIWKYFGELIGITVAERQLSLNALGALLARIQKRSARKMLSDVLIIAVKCSNEENVSELWANSGLQWSSFFESEEDAKDFLQNKKLDFTLQRSRTSSPAQHTSRIQEELRELILKRKARNEEVFEWIDRNVEAAKTKEGPFIRDLVTAVCEASVSQPDGSNSSCKCDQEILKSRKNLLQKYIDSDSTLQLQALYALQSLAVALQHPPGLLKSLFDELYDEDLISEESFYSWECSEDSAESKGKGLALKSTIEFFRWLKSAPEESGDEN